MLELDILKRLGSDKNGHWKINSGKVPGKVPDQISMFHLLLSFSYGGLNLFRCPALGNGKPHKGDSYKGSSPSWNS